MIYTDESVGRGKYFSAFYGGALIRSTDLLPVEGALRQVCAAHHLLGEVKWQKVNPTYLPKYRALLDAFMELVATDRIKIRIMFTPNSEVPIGLSAYHRANAYQILYYQFVKHAFGLPHAGEEYGGVRVRLNMDQLPDTRQKNALFKSHIASLSQSPEFRRSGVTIARDQIAEIDSKRHIVLQCLDVVLGAMQFRLNDKHKLKPIGARRRGAKTLAKEKLYRQINIAIRSIYPNFNIGISTGRRAGLESVWRDQYRHWRFVSQQSQFDPTKTKSQS